jgi:hypothetical protein
MSKSAESDLSRINLLDPPDLIVKKVGMPCLVTSIEHQWSSAAQCPLLH